MVTGPASANITVGGLDHTWSARVGGGAVLEAVGDDALRLSERPGSIEISTPEYLKHPDFTDLADPERNRFCFVDFSHS